MFKTRHNKTYEHQRKLWIPEKVDQAIRLSMIGVCFVVMFGGITLNQMFHNKFTGKVLSATANALPGVRTKEDKDG